MPGFCKPGLAEQSPQCAERKQWRKRKKDLEGKEERKSFEKSTGKKNKENLIMVLFTGSTVEGAIKRIEKIRHSRRRPTSKVISKRKKDS